MNANTRKEIRQAIQELAKARASMNFIQSDGKINDGTIKVYKEICQIIGQLFNILHEREM